MKILGATHVTEDITVDQFDGVVANITTRSFLGFSDDELPIEGRAHNKALNISMKFLNTTMSRVLVDTGSSLNVMPKTTLAKLNIEGVLIKRNS